MTSAEGASLAHQLMRQHLRRLVRAVQAEQLAIGMLAGLCIGPATIVLLPEF